MPELKNLPASDSSDDFSDEEEMISDQEEVLPPRQKKKRTAKHHLVSLLLKIGVTGVTLWVIFHFVIGVSICRSNNAYPMIKDGDLCITFKPAAPAAGDEIVYFHNGEQHFGRVAAQAGDVVDLAGESLTVNGAVFLENTVYPTTAQGAAISFPYPVPDDCVFVLNDHREAPDDSRLFGGIPKEDVQGRVILLLRRRGI